MGSLGETEKSSPDEPPQLSVTDAASPAAVAVAAPPIETRSRRVKPSSQRILCREDERSSVAERTCRRTGAFRRKHFPGTSDSDWNDWRWQLRNRLKTVAELSRVLTMSESEREAVARLEDRLPLAVTPYYASLLDPLDPSQPLRRTCIPTVEEFLDLHGDADDPLSEDTMSPVPGLVHRYPDRVLFLVTDQCAVHCRYCTRSRAVATGELAPDCGRWDRAIEYIASNKAIRDVLISGGDPLTMDDDRIESLLGRLRRIRHVEIIRIGTKAPVVLPQRVTTAFVRMLRRYHPLWMSIHFTHPAELTPEVVKAVERLADAGIPLGSQTVLLKGVNDDTATIKSLMHGLVRSRVRPYYLYQCDPITGSSHFRTPVSKGLEIISGLRGHTTGYAVPHFVIDAPGGGGKIALLPDAVVAQAESDLLLRNYEGNVFRYPDTGGEGAL